MEVQHSCDELFSMVLTTPPKMRVCQEQWKDIKVQGCVKVRCFLCLQCLVILRRLFCKTCQLLLRYSTKPPVLQIAACFASQVSVAVRLFWKGAEELSVPARTEHTCATPRFPSAKVLK